MTGKDGKKNGSKDPPLQKEKSRFLGQRTALGMTNVWLVGEGPSVKAPGVNGEDGANGRWN